MIRQAERLTASQQSAAKVLSGGTGGAQAAQQQAQATERRAQANTRLTQATSGLNRAMRREVDLAERRQREDRRLREQLERLTASTDNVARAERRRAQLQRTLEAAQRRGIVSHQEAARHLRDFDRRQQQAAGSSRRFATSLQRLRESSVLLLGPLSGVGARIQTVSATMNTAGVAALALVGALAGTAGLVFAAQRTAAALDDTIKRADQLGISFERIQQLRFVAAREGIQNIDKALEAFTKRIGEAAQGTGEAQNALDALGLSAERLDRLAPDQQLLAISEAFSEVSSEARQNAIAADLASRANQDLARIFALSREEIEALIERADELGLVLDESAARRAEEMQDRLTELQFIVTQAGKKILADLVPPLTALTEKFVEGAVSAAEFFNNLAGPVGIEEREQQLQRLLEREEQLVEELQRIRERGERSAGGRLGLGDLSETSAMTELQRVRQNIEFVQFALSELRRQQGDESTDPFAKLGAEARTSVEEVEGLLTSIDGLRGRIEAFREGGEGALRVEVATQRAESIVPDLDSDIAREQLALRLDLIETAEQREVSEEELVAAVRERILEEGNLQSTLEALREPSEESVSSAERRAQAEREASLSISQTVSGLAQKAADLREEIQATRDGEEALAALTRERFVEQAILEAMPQLLELSGEARAREVERIRNQAEEVARLQQELSDAQEKARDEAKRTTQDLDRQARERENLLRKPFENAIEGAQRAFRDSFRSIFDEGIDGFEDFGDRVLDLMKDLAAEIAALLVFQPIVQGVAGGGGQGQSSGLLGGILGGGGGGGGISLGSLTQLLGLGGGGGGAGQSLGQLLGLAGGGGTTSLASILETTGLLTLPPGQSTVIAGPPAPGTQGGFGVADVLSAVNLTNIVAGVAGSAVGSQVSSELSLGANPSGGGAPATGSALGSTLGAILGQIFLPIPGLGAFLGGAAGEVLGSAAGGVIGNLEAGEDPFTTQSTSGTKRFFQGFLRGSSVGADPILAGLHNVFQGGLQKEDIAIFAGPGARGDHRFDTPFGQFSLARGNRGFASTVRSIDESIAPLLSSEEIGLVSQRFRAERHGINREFADFDNEAVELAIDRIDTILSAITSDTGRTRAPHENVQVSGITARLIEEAEIDQFDDEDFRRISEALVPRVQEFLAERANLRGRVTALRKAPLEELGQALDPATEVEKAIADVNQQFRKLSSRADELAFRSGFFRQIEEARKRAIALLRRDFEERIELAALEITDPFAAASRKLAEEQERRLEDARRLGADITEVERLNLLEREKLVERFFGRANEQIRSFLQSLESGPQSTLAPEARLEAAETRFQELVQAAQGGDLEARSQVTGAAQNLLDASRQVFASSEMFSQRLDFVTTTLENVLQNVPDLDDLPGFQHGGSFVVGGSGGTDDTLVGFRATRGERVTVTPPGGDSGRLEELLQALGQETAGGTGELSELLEAILGELQAGREREERFEKKLDRLVSKRQAA